jgi:hypothetical protein
MADPLSPATRATKRNLLVASVLAISANAFNVSVDKIPVGGLSINFDNRLFAFLLLVVLLYFFCTFVIYYTIDIKNLEKTAHQTSSEELFQRRVNGFSQTYQHKVQKAVQQVLSPEYRVLINDNFSNRKAKPADKSFYRILQRREPPSNDPMREVDRSKEPEMYSKLDALVADWYDRYPRAASWNKRGLLFVIRLVRLTYFTRNYILDGALPVALALQLSFCFEVCSLSCSLVSSAPE